MLEHIDMVKCASKVKRFEKGHTIIQAGDSTVKEMYILLKGSADAYINPRQATEEHLATYKAGDFFGEMTLFLGQRPAMSVIAAEDIIALPISRGQTGEFFSEQPEAAFALAGELCRRLQAGQVSAKPEEVPAAPALQAQPAPEQPAAAKPPQVSAAEKTPQTTAAAKPAQAAPAVTALFPVEHVHHELPVVGADSEYLFMKNYSCPICGRDFKALAVKASKLVAKHTDGDLRVHYADIEPLYYDVITCPNCWYSALTEMFKEGEASKGQIDQLMKEYKSQIKLRLDENKDSLTVFASYYLALISAPKCFRNHHAATGKLWLKLSRIYDDCQEEKMALYAVGQALNGYMGAYEKSTTPSKQNQQLFYIIGELSLRLNDLPTARKFFFQAKMDKEGSPAVMRHAEDRIEYLRTLK